ncbi:MAG TPA: helix-turn-helix domain-containing protein, partial [Polyangiaceae bacterium]|nr:helix-turn-helix domain-containing protein [Polyangiaceae bacterium]
YTDRGDRRDLEGFTSEALEALAAYDWPGNVRALENAVERAVLLAPGPYIGVADLPAQVTREGRVALAGGALPDEGIDLREMVQEYETTLIRKALEKTGRNKNRAARLLGINRTTLVEMIKRRHL